MRNHYEKSKRKWQKSFDDLLKTIRERQDFEIKNPIEPYVNHKTTINFENPQGYNLLHLAILSGNLDEIKNILREGAKLKNALSIALRNGQLEIAQFLLNQGESATNCELTMIQDPACRKWFRERLKDGIEKSIQSKSSNSFSIFDQPSQNQLFSMNIGFFNDDAGKISILERIAELGDVSPFRASDCKQ